MKLLSQARRVFFGVSVVFVTLDCMIQRRCVLMTAPLLEFTGRKPNKNTEKGLKPEALQVGSARLEWGGLTGRHGEGKGLLPSLFQWHL